MSSYSEIPLSDLRQVIDFYIDSWKVVVVAGVAFQYKRLWCPSALFAWTDPASLGRAGQKEVIGQPDLPGNLRMFKEWCYPPRTLYILNEVLKGGTVDFGKTQVTFANFKFARSGFLSSSGFDHLYADEMKPYTRGLPKLFIEGTLGKAEDWEQSYTKMNTELASDKYLYHTLHDASGSLIGIKTGVPINKGLLQCVLAIPIEVRATTDLHRLKYKISIDRALRGLHQEVRYTIKAEGVQREVKVKLPRVKETSSGLQLSASSTIPGGTEPVSLSLLLDGTRVETVLVEHQPLITRSQKGTESMNKVPIIEATKTLLRVLATGKTNEHGRVMLSPEQITIITGFDPTLLNDAVDLLQTEGFIEVQRYISSGPYHFNEVTVTAKGRLANEQNALQNLLGIPKAKAGNEKKVFVVHGRDDELRRSIFDFLRSIGLQPMEWGEVVHLTGTPNPSIMDILNVAFGEAQTVLVILSPDDLGYLRPELQNPSDPAWEKEPTGQSRPNVLFELGMALAGGINRTVVVQVGDIRPFSDIAGRHILRLTNDPGDRTQLVDRLKTAGCQVDLTGKRDYFSTGDFTPKHLKKPR